MEAGKSRSRTTRWRRLYSGGSFLSSLSPPLKTCQSCNTARFEIEILIGGRGSRVQSLQGFLEPEFSDQFIYALGQAVHSWSQRFQRQKYLRMNVAAR